MAGMSEASKAWATSGQVPNSNISNTYGVEGNTLRGNEQVTGSGVETRIPVGQFSSPPQLGGTSGMQSFMPTNMPPSQWDTPPLASGIVPAPNASALRMQKGQASVGMPKPNMFARKAGFKSQPDFLNTNQFSRGVGENRELSFSNI